MAPNGAADRCGRLRWLFRSLWRPHGDAAVTAVVATFGMGAQPMDAGGALIHFMPTVQPTENASGSATAGSVATSWAWASRGTFRSTSSAPCSSSACTFPSSNPPPITTCEWALWMYPHRARLCTWACTFSGLAIATDDGINAGSDAPLPAATRDRPPGRHTPLDVPHVRPARLTIPVAALVPTGGGPTASAGCPSVGSSGSRSHGSSPASAWR